MSTYPTERIAPEYPVPEIQISEPRVPPAGPEPAGANEVFQWLHQGFWFGFAISLMIAALGGGEFESTVILGVILGLTLWPCLAAFLHATEGSRNGVTILLRFCGKVIGGLVLLAFAAAMLLLIGAKLLL